MKNHAHLIFLVGLLNNYAIAEDEHILDGELALLTSCKTFDTQPKHTHALPCIHYIKGFLAGVWSLDQIVATNPKDNIKDMSTWADRRYDIRYGRKREQLVATGFTHYCSPDNTSEIRFLQKISNIETSNITSIKELNAKILIALKATCPAVKIQKK